MNLQLLVYFKTVAELQHFTRAANQLYITQPALSKAIHSLEAELGTVLFEKDGRNAVLTRSGLIFYKHIKKALEDIDNGVQAVQRQTQIESNTIFLSTLYSMHATYLPEKILAFRRRHPCSRFSLEYKYTSIVLQDILQGRAELGICSNFSVDKEYASLKKLTLFHEPIGLIVSKDHPFAQRERIGVEELKEEQFIVYVRSNRGTNGILTELCKAHGFYPNITGEAYNDYGVLGMVQAGEGIAMIPLVDAIKLNGLVQVTLALDTPLSREINLVWHSERPLSPMAKHFCAFLLENGEVEGANTFEE